MFTMIQTYHMNNRKQEARFGGARPKQPLLRLCAEPCPPVPLSPCPPPGGTVPLTPGPPVPLSPCPPPGGTVPLSPCPPPGGTVPLSPCPPPGGTVPLSPSRWDCPPVPLKVGPSPCPPVPLKVGLSAGPLSPCPPPGDHGLLWTATPLYPSPVVLRGLLPGVWEHQSSAFLPRSTNGTRAPIGVTGIPFRPFLSSVGV
ncbi:unnamed protein product [Gadus morhua 'NCC']